MALEGVVLDPGAGGATIATDTVGGLDFQVVKLATGADGAADLVSNSAPIPVSDAGGTLTVDGTVAVTNAGLTELAAAINASSQMDVNIAASVAIAVTDNGGNLSIDDGGNTITVDGAVVVTNAGTFAVQVDGSALTSLQLIDDPVATLGTTTYAETTSKGMIVAAVRRDADTTLVDTTNELGPLQMDANGRLKVEAFSGETLPVSGTVTANLAAGTNNIGDVDVLTVPADPFGANADAASATGSISAKLRFIASTGIPVTALPASTNTIEVVGDVAHDAPAAGNPVLLGAYASAAAPTDVSGDADAVRLWALRNGSPVVNLAYGGTLVTATTVQETVGDVADDAATAGNPVLVAGVAVETDGTDPTTVSAEGDAAYLRTDRARRLLVSQHHPRGWWVSADYGSAQTNASVKAAPGASLSLYITDIVISNGATAGNVTLLDGSGGTVVFEIYPAINGGCTISVKNPIRLTANTALCITSTTVTTHSVNIGGYTAP